MQIEEAGEEPALIWEALFRFLALEPALPLQCHRKKEQGGRKGLVSHQRAKLMCLCWFDDLRLRHGW